MPGEESKLNPENPVDAQPGISPGDPLQKVVIDPASNVAPFMRFMNEMKDKYNTLENDYKWLKGMYELLKSRIDAYDKFFGGEPPPVPAIATPPVIIPTDETPTHIKRGVHGTERNAGGKTSG
ncbi:hypothetical protein LCGC14_0266990 [marine sediment metagenome]|uniref:Uncharacterized protein n=1 Tax=marine sediment metagenome TaxID=412755 RepID=A0A0F9X4P5_9ZZZZ